MERIEKALEKAREQRKAVTGEDSHHAKKAPSAGQSSGRVSYEKTKVRPVAPESLREKRIVAGSAHDSEADLFRMLRAQVLQRLSATDGRTFGISSPNPEEGKTFVAVNLAISLAMDINHTVLLVDLDLRRPSVADYFDLKVDQGLSDYLFNRAELSDCLVNPGIERLVLLPVGKALHNSSETLASPRMMTLAQELKEKYPDRIVIYDLPPLLTSDDTMVFLPHIDATLLVVQEGSTCVDDIDRSLDLLDREKLLGTVLNQSSERTSNPYY